MKLRIFLLLGHLKKRLRATRHLHIRQMKSSSIFYFFVLRLFDTDFDKTIAKGVEIRTYCQEASKALMSAPCAIRLHVDDDEFPEREKPSSLYFSKAPHNSVSTLLNHRLQVFVTIRRKSPWNQNTIPTKGKCLYYSSHSSVTAGHF